MTGEESHEQVLPGVGRHRPQYQLVWSREGKGGSWDFFLLPFTAVDPDPGYGLIVMILPYPDLYPFQPKLNVFRQFCGSRMFILDPKFFHPGSASKNLSITVYPKKLVLSFGKYDLGCSSRIQILIFFPSRAGSKGQKGTGSRIRICSTVYRYLYRFVQQVSSRYRTAEHWLWISLFFLKGDLHVKRRQRFMTVDESAG